MHGHVTVGQGLAVHQASQPFVDRGAVDRGLIADGQPVVTGRHRPVTLEPVDPGLHGRDAAGNARHQSSAVAHHPSLLAPVRGLIILDRDRAKVRDIGLPLLAVRRIDSP